jgi:hypothetical protein
MTIAARFFSDTGLENFKDEAELIGFDVGHVDQGTRDVTIATNDFDSDETLRALVHLNGGDVIDAPRRNRRKRERRKSERRKRNL